MEGICNIKEEPAVIDISARTYHKAQVELIYVIAISGACLIVGVLGGYLGSHYSYRDH